MTSAKKCNKEKNVSNTVVSSVLYLFFFSQNHVKQFFSQNVSNGSQDFNEVPKYSLQELQVPAEELPSGVDAGAREVSLLNTIFVYLI